MDRALRLAALREALGEHPRILRPPARQDVDEPSPPEGVDVEQGAPADRPDAGAVPTADQFIPVLPTPEELQQVLAEAEVQIFLNQRNLPASLVTTGWYLHGVASAATSAEIFTPERQRRAFAVSAHIFDLATLSETSGQDRLSHTFAAQVGYHRSDQEPNALAMARRASVLLEPAEELLEDVPSLALKAGIALLGLDLTRLQRLTAVWRSQFAQLVTDTGVEDLAVTMFGPTSSVVQGVALLARFLATGRRAVLASAREFFDSAVQAPDGEGDRTAKWVAAHLRFLADEMDAGSVWSMLPPELPDGAKQAFTLTRPNVLTLWRPQRELLTMRQPTDGAGEAAPNALAPSVRRILLSVPTSAGKTLLAQLIIVAHLAAGQSGVCYVVPQRSLGREVRRDLGRRLRVLARDIGRDEPDFHIPADGPIAEMLRAMGLGTADLVDAFKDPNGLEDDVAVMTPERLAHALRDDPEAVLQRYSLFVFDEAHLISERCRGFLLESTLAFLHWRTRTTHHRIVLLSAALGNAGQLAQWLQLDAPPVLLKSDWRGPRRLNAIFNTEIDWNNPRVETVDARGAKAHLTKRLTYDTFGVVRLRPAADRPAQVKTTTPIGVTCFRATEQGEREHSPESNKGTPLYKMLAYLAQYVGHAGPVLVIRSTRSDAVGMAKAIAEDLDDDPHAQALAEFAEIRLGTEHPLPGLLRKGVAYHHAGLPIDLQDAIEEASRADVLTYIVATSTLTEGVNLPVRTVVLAALPYPNQPVEQQLTGARLINAIGRAGRAAKESEGWAILARAARPSPSDFALLEPSETELEVRSSLAADEALGALAIFEEAVRAGHDVVAAAGSAISDFVAFCWFVLSAQEEVDGTYSAAEPVAAFQSTLAYAQLDAGVRSRYEQVAAQVATAYAAADPGRRRRWTKTGTSIASAQKLDALAVEVAHLVRSLDDDSARQVQEEPVAALELLERARVFERLLDLPERPKVWKFHQTTSSLSPEFNVSPVALLRQWIGGQDLAAIADNLLADITDRAYRLERLVDTVTDFCEHYFAWTLGALLALTNEYLADTERRVAPDLGVYARYGVSTTDAVALLLSGVRSRELSARVAEAANVEDVAGPEIRTWLSGQTVAEWRERYSATTADIADLLEYCRPRGRSALQSLLADGSITLTVQLVESDGEASSDELTLRRQDAVAAPAPIAVYGARGTHVALVPPSLHSEVELILDTGLPLRVSLEGSELQIVIDE